MKFIVSLLAVVVLAGSTAELRADGPSSGWGAGFETGEFTGANAFFILSPMIQVGSAVGLQIQENANIFYLSPQVKFLFDIGMAATVLALDAQFRLLFGDASTSALVVRLGMLHWLSQQFALYGGVNVLELGFDPSSTTIGILSAFVGMQFVLSGM